MFDRPLHSEGADGRFRLQSDDVIDQRFQISQNLIAQLRVALVALLDDGTAI